VCARFFISSKQQFTRILKRRCGIKATIRVSRCTVSDFLLLSPRKTEQYHYMPLRHPIIFIDDDQDDQYLFGQAIKDLQIPHPVIFFTNGLDALNYLLETQDHPSLVFCDVNMPLINGLELRRKMISYDQVLSKAIPFIFLTTYSNARIVEESQTLMVQGVFEKSSDYGDFTRQIAEVISLYQKST
jgi:CheY-like chemotaxis protein